MHSSRMRTVHCSGRHWEEGESARGAGVYLEWCVCPGCTGDVAMSRNECRAVRIGHKSKKALSEPSTYSSATVNVPVSPSSDSFCFNNSTLKGSSLRLAPPGGGGGGE